VRAAMVVALITVGGASSISCSSGDVLEACVDSTTPIASRTGAIVGGTTSSAYLALGAAQEHAIVRVQGEVGGSRKIICSGVLVFGEVVITAKHCVEDLPPEILSLGIGPPGPPLMIRSVTQSPTVDLAVLAPDWETSITALSLELEPLSVATALDATAEGHRVMLAGFGEDDAGSTGGLLFATEVIAKVEDDVLTTTGFGASGACAGDSGGPLLGRDASGEVTVLGILSSGSASCQGTDRFVRLDQEAAWLAAAGVGGVGHGSCGQLSAAGRCYDGRPVWCEEGEIRSESCPGAFRCGWDPVREAYRCVDPQKECAGADGFGDCADGRLTVCGSDGRIEVKDCLPCARCGFDPASGVASCFE
jgi:hypothetical protein